MQLTEVKKGQTGTGLLIENDGYISINSKENKLIKEALESGDGRNIPNPFVLSAVFQKYGIENANGRIYPEDILKREVEKYQQAIRERRAYGECYTPDAFCLCEHGLKPISQIEVGEKVFTLNTETNETEIKEVTYIVKYFFNGKLATVKSKYIDDRLTKNHSYPLYKNTEEFYDFVTVGEIMDKKEKYKDYLIPISSNLKLGEPVFEKIQDITFDEVDYKGDVYCIEVPNHTWFVQQNNKEHWTKNCNHPESSCIDLGRIAMNILELHWEGHTLVGKLEIPISDGFRNLGIVSTCADTVAQWIISGLKVGVSSRGLGSVTQQMGKLIVGDDFEIVCWDVVSQPSTPNAWIETNDEKLRPYLESKEDIKNNIIKENKFSKFQNWLND